MNPIDQLYPKDNQKLTTIFSINSLMNKEEELKLVRNALPCGVKQVQGCWNDLLEVSYVAHTSSLEAIDKIAEFCGDHGQEAILTIDSDMTAIVYYLDTGVANIIGKFTASNPAEAMEGGAWTRDGSQFFIVK